LENNTELSREILNEFLDRWDIEAIKSMKLEQYVSIGDKDTFCQWLETKTRALGSIKGINSSKFGIYKRSNPDIKPKNLVNDNLYSWQRYYGENRKEAFENVKAEILKIIDYSERGDFEKIENLHLTLFVKWKIAYLYSNERLIPIFKKAVLHKIAEHYALTVTRKTKTSEIQNLIIANKPSHLSIYQFADSLYEKYGRDNGKTINTRKKRKTKRKGTTSRNTTKQKRKGSTNYIAEQKHNKIQEVLQKRLENKYGKDNVVLEENFVDIKVKLENEIHFYEVKSSAFASDCIREGLGQIMSYMQKDDDDRTKLLFIAGQYAPNQDESDYLNFVKKKLKIDFDYVSVELKD
jgi:hypothetical protein